MKSFSEYFKTLQTQRSRSRQDASAGKSLLKKQFQIQKSNDDRMLAFGWANVSLSSSKGCFDRKVLFYGLLRSFPPPFFIFFQSRFRKIEDAVIWGNPVKLFNVCLDVIIQEIRNGKRPPDFGSFRLHE